MNQKSKKKKANWQQYIGILIFILSCSACGIVTGECVSRVASPEEDMGKGLLVLAVLLIGMYAAFFLQLVLHEAGHLIFGLMSGYKFFSYRIGSFMWMKEDGKLRFCRFSLAGTGGQCLMTPPEMVDGKFPVILYNLGGSLMNMIAAVIFLGLSFVLRNAPIASAFMMTAAILGFADAIVNGVPMRTGTVDNDGYNALSLGKNKDALRAFWIQMKVNEQQGKGIRAKDMPEEWFAVPSDEAMKNSMVAGLGVFSCNRLIDAHQFEEADRLMEHLLAIDSSIAGLHRNLLICDRIYCELIGENSRDVVDQMLTKEQKKVMKAMKNNPSVLRTGYSYVLLAQGNAADAEKIMERFEACAKTYPYPVDVQAERELIRIAEERYEKFQAEGRE